MQNKIQQLQWQQKQYRIHIVPGPWQRWQLLDQPNWKNLQIGSWHTWLLEMSKTFEFYSLFGCFWVQKGNLKLFETKKLDKYWLKNALNCFIHPIFRFLFLVTFGNKVTKMRKYDIIFVYILQGKMGKTGKTRKETTQLKWPKYQKPKDKNMGWTKQ